MMYEDLYAPLPDRQAYLARIGYKKQTVCNTDDLDTLVFSHLCAVPFENLDVLGSDREPSILTHALFDKIVSRRRGGYCYELNTLFSKLLQELGLDVYVTMARICWNKPEKSPYSHMAVVTCLEGKRWLCDVGYGGPAPRGILCLDTQERQQVRGADFRVFQDENRVEIRRFEGASELPMMEFLLQRVDLVDFIPLNFHTALRPDSVFRQQPMVSIHTPEGIKTFDGSTFREKSGAETVRERFVPSTEAAGAILSEEFGILL